ncbi:putative aliphatic sulfonates transport permease protein SsuC [compost metagenome]|nr:ABC transporter permease [Agrobacterium tumefaciens]
MRDLATLLGLGKIQRFVQIEFPSALPEIFVGLKIGAVQALVGAVLAEWMSGKLGLGYLMTYAAATYKTPLLFAAVLLTVALGLVMHVVLSSLENRLLSWKGTRK